MNIRDIARLSGVGVSTVSRVLNNHEDVKESTRERVMNVIKESNYIPNNSARMLKQNVTNNVGVLVKGVFNPLFSEMTNVIGNIINASKYAMILEQNDYTKGDDINTLQSIIKEKRLQGVICLGGNFDKDSRKILSSLGVPIVLTSVNAVVEEVGYSSVGIDNVEAAYKATKYLIDLGHKDILVFIGDKEDTGISYSRLQGYKNAITEAGLEFKVDNIIEGDYSTETAYVKMRSYLKNKGSATAVFAISDFMAIGVAKAVVDEGQSIGDDISIVGFDGMDVSEFYNPGITTIKQPKVEIAQKSAELMLDLLKGKKENKHYILSTELIERKSCKRIK